jgi:hypothetical protein
MTFETAQRATEILLALAFLQQCAEHIFAGHGTHLLYTTRGLLSIALVFGLQSHWMALALSAHSVIVLHRHNGPYNGGSDRMGLLVLYCLSLSHWLPDTALAQAAFGYLGVQVVLSYFISGQVKIVNPAWRNGAALRDVFRFSAYPVAEDLRCLANYPRLLWSASWSVMLFEVLFPLSLVHANLLLAALVLATFFHVANACLFGLNRFVWFWIASYPSILWLQAQLAQSF